MLVHEVMTREVVTVRPDASLKDAARLLDGHGITAMPVVDRSGRVVGVLSEADVIEDALLPGSLHRLLRGGPPTTRVAEVMDHHPVTVSSVCDLAGAAELLTSTGVKSRPVVDDGALVGVVSRRDLLRWPGVTTRSVPRWTTWSAEPTRTGWWTSPTAWS